MRTRRRWTLPHFTRDSILFAVGLLGMVHEFFLPEPRAIVLGMCALLMGLPITTNKDR